MSSRTFLDTSTKRQNSTILLVEDEDDTASLVQLMCERKGFTVVRARDGRVALALMTSMAPTSLVLLDMILPYHNGYEVLESFRRDDNWKTVPIVMLTANSYKPDAHKAMLLGATRYIVKEDGPEKLSAVINSVLENIYA